jgi:hypothetical protein
LVEESSASCARGAGLANRISENNHTARKRFCIVLWIGALMN